MRIMVPVDGSPLSEQALPMAMDFAERCDAEVHVVRVHQFPMASALDMTSAYASDAIERETRASEIEYLNRLGASGQRIRTFSLNAPIADALAEHVQKHDIDLVVMTTHGRGGLSRAWLGSVADRVVRTVTIPVLLRRPVNAYVEGTSVATAPVRILIPLDGSELAESIIDPAIAIGKLTGASYTLVQVIPSPITASAGATAHFAMSVVVARREATTYLNAHAARLRSRGISVGTRVIMQSNTAAGIIEEAIESDCDLIAMATHGRSGWSRIALGSIADKVLRSAPVPLLVLKPDTEKPIQRLGA